MYTWERLDTTLVDPRHPNVIGLPIRRRIKAIRFKVPPGYLCLSINGYECCRFLMDQQLVFDGVKLTDEQTYVRFSMEVSDARSLEHVELLTSSTHNSKYPKLGTRCRLVKWYDCNVKSQNRDRSSPIQECEYRLGYVLFVQHMGSIFLVMGSGLKSQEDVVRYLETKTGTDLPNNVILAVRAVNRMLFGIHKELGDGAWKHSAIQRLTGLR